MFKNLERLLREKNISHKDFAAFLGVTEKTVYNKIKGKTPFSYPEAKKTGKLLFPEYQIDFIFSQDEHAS